MENRQVTREEVDEFLDNFLPLIGKQGQKHADIRGDDDKLRKPLARIILEFGLPQRGAISNYACPVVSVIDYVADQNYELGSGDERSQRQALSNTIAVINERIAESPLAGRLLLCLHGAYVYGVTDLDTIAYVQYLQRLPFGIKTLSAFREAVLFAFFQAGTNTDKDLASKIDSKGFRKVPSRLETTLTRAQLPAAAVKMLLAGKRPSNALLQLKTEAREPYAPPLPPQLIGRAETLRTLRRWITPGRRDSQRRVGLHGLPGVGKTAIMAKLVSDKTLKDAYGDEIFWTNIGQEREGVSILLDLLARTTSDRLDVAGEQEIGRAFQESFSDKQCLIVLDDIWSDEQLRPFRKLTGLSCVVALSRNKELLEHSFGERSLFEVAPLDDNFGQEVLLSHCHPQEGDLPILSPIVAKCAGLPLALAIVGEMAKRLGFKTVLDILSQSDLARLKALIDSYHGTRSAYSKEGHVSLFRAIDSSIEFLESDDKNRYLSLTVLQEKSRVTPLALQTLWSLNSGQVKSLVDTLAHRSLVTFQDGVLTLHDMLLAYLVCRAKTDNALHDYHRAALCAYADDCVKSGADLFRAGQPIPWWHCADDGYFDDALVHHLLSADMPEVAVSLLCDSPEWMQRRSARGRSYILDDIRRTEGFLSGTKEPTSHLPSLVKMALLRAQILTGPSSVARKSFELLTLLGRAEEAKRLASAIGGVAARIDATVQISRGLRFHRKHDLEMLAIAIRLILDSREYETRNRCIADLAAEYLALGQCDMGISLCSHIHDFTECVDEITPLLNALAAHGLHGEAEKVLGQVRDSSIGPPERAQAALVYLENVTQKAAEDNDSLRAIAHMATPCFRHLLEPPSDSDRFAATCQAFAAVDLNDVAEHSLTDLGNAIDTRGTHGSFTLASEFLTLARGYAVLGRERNARSCISKARKLLDLVESLEDRATLLCHEVEAAIALNDEKMISTVQSEILTLARRLDQRHEHHGILRSLLCALLTGNRVEDAKALRKRAKDILADACRLEMAVAYASLGNTDEAVRELEAEKTDLAEALENVDKAGSGRALCFAYTVIEIASEHPTPDLLSLVLNLCSSEALPYLMRDDTQGVVKLLIQANKVDLAIHFVDVYLGSPTRPYMPWFISLAEGWAKSYQRLGRDERALHFISRTEEFCREEMPATKDRHVLYAFAPVYFELGRDEEGFRIFEDLRALQVSPGDYRLFRLRQNEALDEIGKFLFCSNRLDEAPALFQSKGYLSDDPEYDMFLVLECEALRYFSVESDQKAVLNRISSLATRLTNTNLANGLWGSLAEICSAHGPLDLAKELLAHVSDKDEYARLSSTLALRLAKEGRAEEAEHLIDAPLGMILEELKNSDLLSSCLGDIAETLCEIGRRQEAQSFLERVHLNWMDTPLPDRFGAPASVLLDAFFRTGEYITGLSLVKTIDPVLLFSLATRYFQALHVQSPEILFLEMVRSMGFSSSFWQRYYLALIAED